MKIYYRRKNKIITPGKVISIPLVTHMIVAIAVL
jgi:hypothetical protein